MKKKIKNIHFLCNSALFINILSYCFLINFLLSGSICLLLRYFIPSNIILIFLITGFLVFFLILSAIIFYQKRISIESISAIADKTITAGGLILLSSAIEKFNIDDYVSKPEYPSVKINILTDILRFILPVFFLLLSLFIPVSVLNLKNDENKPLDISFLKDKLSREINELNEAKLITEEEKIDLNEVLNNIEKNAQAENPGKAYEELSALDEKINSIESKRIEETLSGMELMKEIEKNFKMDDFSEIKQNTELLRELLKENPVFNERIGNSVNDLNFGEAALNKLNKDLEKARIELSEAIKESIKNNHLDLSKEEIARLLSVEEIEAYIGESLIDGELEEYLALKEQFEGDVFIAANGKAGNRDFNNYKKISIENEKFQINSEIIDIEKSELITNAYEIPEIEIINDKEFGVLNIYSRSGGTAKKYYIAPHQREIIRRYFNQN